MGYRKVAAIRYHPDHHERMHPDLHDAIEMGDTPYHFNASIPRGRYMDDTASSQFEKTVNDTRKSTNLDSADDALTQINRIRKKIQALETGHENQLEQIAIRLVEENYGIQSGEIEWDVKIVESGDIDNSGVMSENPEPVPPELQNEVDKRRMVNSFIQGAALKAKNLYYLALNEINTISPQLAKLYKMYASVSNYNFWQKPGRQISMDGDDGGEQLSPPPPVPKAGGMVYLDLSGDVPKIIARATTFVVLLSEMVKGVMELISIHGAPKDPEVRQKVFEHADTYHNERWDLRFGPVFWDKLLEHMNVEDPRLRAMLHERITSLPANQFHAFVNDVLRGGSQSKDQIEKWIQQINSGQTGEESWRDTLSSLVTARQSMDIDGQVYIDCTGMGLSGSIAAAFGVIRRQDKSWCPQSRFPELEKLMAEIEDELREKNAATLTPERHHYLRNRDPKSNVPNPQTWKMVQDDSGEVKWQRQPGQFFIDQEDTEGMVDRSHAEYSAGYNWGYMEERDGHIPQNFEQYLLYSGTDAYNKGKEDGAEDARKHVPNRYSSLDDEKEKCQCCGKTKSDVDACPYCSERVCRDCRDSRNHTCEPEK